MDASSSYRSSHVAPDFGKKYSDYQLKPFKSLTISLETRMLNDLFNHMPPIGKYLDFACGTGRITGIVAPRVREAHGVDISSDMLKVARERLPAIDFIQADITDRSGTGFADLKAKGPFQVITSFRFFLNAEHALRIEALRSLYPLLADEGWLIFNIHKNRTSLRWGFEWLREKLRGRPSESVSYAYMAKLLRDEGFRVERVEGYFFLSYDLSLKMPRFYWSVDRVLGKLPLLRQLTHFQIYVCRKMK